ncbi:MAG TPA: hypothetical protein VJ724_14155 [Tahibacter sp.]|nr:hypothetical protein [Tahibacter sp.]
MKATCLTLLLAALSLSPAFANDAPAPVREIGKTDALRKPLLDALRTPIEKDLGQEVQFVVRTLRVQGDWAFVVAQPQRRDGSPVDYGKTRYAEAITEGLFDGGTVFALLRSADGRWKTTAFVIGATDVAYAAWPDEYGAPRALFGLPDEG